MNDSAAAPAATKNVEAVKMSDGRTVEFVGKRKLLKDSIGSDKGGPAVRLDFRNGQTITFALPADLIERFALHGAEQKLGDETAGTEDVNDMIFDVEALIERLNKGEWRTTREGTGVAGISILMKALMELSGKDAEHVKAFLNGKTQKEKLALRGSKQLKPIIDRLEAEKAATASSVDTDALLGSL